MANFKIVPQAKEGSWRYWWRDDDDPEKTPEDGYIFRSNHIGTIEFPSNTDVGTWSRDGAQELARAIAEAAQLQPTLPPIPPEV